MLNLYKKPYKMTPIEWVRWFLQCLKFTWQRARWGFSEKDVYNFDVYHSELIAAIMTYMQANNNSYPSNMSNEEWHKILKDIAHNFSQWNEDLPTPCYDKYSSAIEDKNTTPEMKYKLIKDWAKEEEDNYAYKLKKLKEGFDLLYEHYPNLWD